MPNAPRVRYGEHGAAHSVLWLYRLERWLEQEYRDDLRRFVDAAEFYDDVADLRRRADEIRSIDAEQE